MLSSNLFRHPLLTGCNQSQKDLPSQLLSSAGPLEASLVVASFGSSKPYNSRAFDLSIVLDSPLPAQDKPLRYGKLPEIHHIFKSDPTSPPKFITIVFTAAVVFALPVLLATVRIVTSVEVSADVRRIRANSECAVGISGRESEPCHQGVWKLPDSSCAILPFDTGNGGRFLHVLHIMESVPNLTWRRWNRIDHFLERKQSIARSSTAKIGRISMRDVRRMKKIEPAITLFLYNMTYLLYSGTIWFNCSLSDV